MIDLLNKKIKLYLVNSLVAEGIVTHQSDELLELSNSANEHLLYVNNPDQNIIMFLVLKETQQEIMPQELKTIHIDEKIKNILRKKDFISQEEQEPTQSLQELYKHKSKIEKEMIKRKLLNFDVKDVNKEQSYGRVYQLNDFNFSEKTKV
jgi:hypothetical protein